jgi:hypothetical protein
MGNWGLGNDLRNNPGKKERKEITGAKAEK